MQDGDIKVYNAPGSPIYLVQRIDSDNFLIHREVSKIACDTLGTGQVIEHEGKHFLYNVLNCPNLETAEPAIQRYFKAHSTLVQRIG